MASSENTLTGVDGEFVVGTTRVARTTKWSVSETLATKSEWGDSDTAGYTARAAGRKDATFSTEGKFSTADEVWEIFAIGDNPEATLWMDGESLYWNFPCALCMDFQLTVDMDTQEVIGWTSNWGADGLFYRPGQTGAPSKSPPSE
jgi:hypothetical protein